MDNLRSLLEEKKIPFELIKHDTPILTAEEGARYFGINVGQTAPTLIIWTDKGFFALIISGDRGRVDFSDVAGVLGCKKVRLAGAKEVQKVTGYEVGSVSLVGHNLPCIFDTRLLRYPSVYGGTGKATCTLKIDPYDLEKINKVVATLPQEIGHPTKEGLNV